MDDVPKEVALIILEMARDKEGAMGIGKLALLLKGSHSKLVGDIETKYKSTLFWYPREVLENFIKQLIDKGFLMVKVLGFYPDLRPVIYLTEEGREAIGARRNIQLEVVRKERTLKLNESMRLTLEAFQRTKSVAKTAEKRGLAASTIWKHLTDLVGIGRLKVGDIVSGETIGKVVEAKKRCSRESVREVKWHLPDISYEEIRLVLADKSL